MLVRPSSGRPQVVAKPASLKFAISAYYLLAALAVLGTLWGGEGPSSFGYRGSTGVFSHLVPALTRNLARCHDLAIGYCYFAFFLPLAAVRVVDVVQTWLLFHNALSEGPRARARASERAAAATPRPRRG